MNKERLLKLASELERCSRGQVLKIPGDGKALFDMGTVVEKINPDYNEHSCGTAACAMGFAGLHPWFRKRGLEWSPLKQYLKINNRTKHYEQVASLFFGITTENAIALFGGQYGTETPKQVAKRIRKFVVDHA